MGENEVKTIGKIPGRAIGFNDRGTQKLVFLQLDNDAKVYFEIHTIILEKGRSAVFDHSRLYFKSIENSSGGDIFVWKDLHSNIGFDIKSKYHFSNSMLKTVFLSDSDQEFLIEDLAARYDSVIIKKTDEDFPWTHQDPLISTAQIDSVKEFARELIDKYSTNSTNNSSSINGSMAGLGVSPQEIVEKFYSTPPPPPKYQPKATVMNGSRHLYSLRAKISDGELFPGFIISHEHFPSKGVLYIVNDNGFTCLQEVRVGLYSRYGLMHTIGEAAFQWFDFNEGVEGEDAFIRPIFKSYNESFFALSCINLFRIMENICNSWNGPEEDVSDPQFTVEHITDELKRKGFEDITLRNQEEVDNYNAKCGLFCTEKEMKRVMREMEQKKAEREADEASKLFFDKKKEFEELNNANKIVHWGW